MTNLANDTKLQTPITEWRYRYNPFGEREQKRMYNSPLGDMGYEMYPWVYYQLGIDNKQYAVYYGAQTNNSYVNMSNITMTAKPDPNRETVFFYPVEYNVYGNESLPKITYKYVDGYWQKQYKIYDYLGSLRYTISQMNKVLNYKAYDPYGNEIIDTLKQTRQGYIGKENDVENGLGDHGVRKYEPGTGRFNSVDPLWEKYLGWSPYQYCKNNPIWGKDYNGMYFDTYNLTPDDKKTFDLNMKLISLSETGAKLLDQLAKSSYPINIYSGINGSPLFGYASAFPKNENELAKVDVVIDFKNSPNNLKTQLEELIHVQQNDNATNKIEYNDKVHKEFKSKPYKFRFYEIQAKKEVSSIIDEINSTLSEIKEIPKVFNNQLPSQK